MLSYNENQKKLLNIINKSLREEYVSDYCYFLFNRINHKDYMGIHNNFVIQNFLQRRNYE